MRQLVEKILFGRLLRAERLPEKALIDLFGDTDNVQTLLKTDLAPEILNYLTQVPIGQIHANEDQVRKTFDQSKIEELAKSIQANGVIQPILIRKHPTLDTLDGVQQYQIIAGERRWRASKIAKIKQMPTVILNLGEDQIFQISLIENIQREKLNPIDEARAIKSLADTYGHSYTEIAKLLGKSRSHIVNTIRLLKLPDPVKSKVVNGDISRGHARAIIASEDPENLVREITEHQLNVRQTEKRVKTLKQSVIKPPPPDTARWLLNVVNYERKIRNLSGHTVELRKNGKSGLTLKTHFKTQAELDAFMDRFKAAKI